jgi:hypothetical protein
LNLLLGHAVFYHCSDIIHFLGTVEGTRNTLIKAVNVDIKEDLYAAGARALGLISNFLCTIMATLGIGRIYLVHECSFSKPYEIP